MKIITPVGITLGTFLVCMFITSGLFHFTDSYQVLVNGRYASMAIATIAGIVYFWFGNASKRTKIIFLVAYFIVCPYTLMFLGLFVSCMLGDCI